MKKTILLSLSIAAIAIAAMFCEARPAKAVPQFRKEFVAKYVKSDSSDPKDKAFAAAVKKARCNICHAGADKEKRNPYGQAISKFISKEEQENKEKFLESLDKAAGVKVKPDDAKSPTFGERISAGKLPCEVAK